MLNPSLSNYKNCIVMLMSMCSLILHRCNTVTVVPHMTLQPFGNPRVAFPVLEAGVVCSRSAVSEKSCICDRCLFREGLHLRRVFDWDDSIAYDCSFF